MKHVFLVHGHITYYLSRSIIQYLSIPEEDVLLLLARGYNNEFNNLNSYSLGDIIFIGERINSINFFKFYPYITQLDADIEKLLGASTKFKVYLPHIGHPVMQILATNPNCVEVNYMEEGSNCYAKNFLNNPVRTSVKFRINQFLGSALSAVKLYGKGRYFKVKLGYDTSKVQDKFNSFYTISEIGFSTIEAKKTVIPFYAETKLTYKPKYKNLLILEAGVEQKWISRAPFFEALDFIFGDNKDVKELSVKFHPAQTEENVKEILALLNKHQITYDIIPNTIGMEQVFYNNKDLFVIGFASSLLLYAVMFGHDIKSYEQHLKDIDPVYKDFRIYNDFNVPDVERYYKNLR